MATTMAQALADRIRYQASHGQKALEAAGEQCGAVFGNPADVLTVRGNVSDVALTNHLWLLDAVAAGAVQGELPPSLRSPRPLDIEGAIQFLAPRDRHTAEESLAHLRAVNEQIAAMVERLPDSALDKPVEVTFYGTKNLRDMLFIIIEHGSLHLGQAWGILKGKGIAG
jgi:hypothetical protein